MAPRLGCLAARRLKPRRRRWKIWRRSCAAWPPAIRRPCRAQRRGRSRFTSAPSHPNAARAPWSRSRIASPPGSRATRASSTSARRRCWKCGRRAWKGSAIEWLRERAGTAHGFCAGRRRDRRGHVPQPRRRGRVGAGQQRSRSCDCCALATRGARGNGETLRWILAVRRSATDSEAFRHHGVSRCRDRSRLALCLPFASRLQPLAQLRSAADSADTRKHNVGGLVLHSSRRSRLAEAFGSAGVAARGRTWMRRPSVSTTPPNRRGRGSTSLTSGTITTTTGSVTALCGRYCIPSRTVSSCRSEMQAYRQANELFASMAARLVGPKDAVWLHDYHLFLLGQRLRERGHKGPIGLFSTCRFPRQTYSSSCRGRRKCSEIARAGSGRLQAPGHVENFRRCIAALPGTLVATTRSVPRPAHTDRGLPNRDRPGGLREPAATSTGEEVAGLMRSIAPDRLVLGVDASITRREFQSVSKDSRVSWRSTRNSAERFRSCRFRCPRVATCRPTRAAPARRDHRRAHERRVRRGASVPIRYLYRSYRRDRLSELYRASAVGYVTPLRDGMNLVAKEWVAAQNPDDPGVLVLSRFAGPAIELTDAPLTSP